MTTEYGTAIYIKIHFAGFGFADLIGRVPTNQYGVGLIYEDFNRVPDFLERYYMYR